MRIVLAIADRGGSTFFPRGGGRNFFSGPPGFLGPLGFLGPRSIFMTLGQTVMYYPSGYFFTYSSKKHLLPPKNQLLLVTESFNFAKPFDYI